MRDEPGDDDARLTTKQRDALLKMLEQDERVAWWWASLRVWATWVSAGIVGGYATYKAAIEFIRGGS